MGIVGRTRIGLVRALAALALALTLTCATGAVSASAVTGPRIDQITNHFGPPAGGQHVRIEGFELGEASAVYFGSTPAASFTVASERLIDATTPPGEVGTVYVTVVTPKGTTTTTEVTRYVYVHTPEFGTCEKLGFGAGSFTVSGCQVPQSSPEGNAEWEWFPGFGGPNPLNSGEREFTLTSAKQIKLETVGKHVVTCSGLSGDGEIDGPSTMSLGVLTLTGCESSGLGACQSVEAAAGEIRTSALEGELGDTSVNPSPAKDVVGVDVEPVEGETIAGFFCGVAPASLRGSVIIGLKTPNKMKSSTSWKGVEKRGVQKTTAFVGGAEAHLEMSLGDEAPLEEAGIKITATGQTPFPWSVEFNTSE